MSDSLPHAAQPANQPRSRALSPAALTAIVIGAFLATLTMVGLCAGVVSLGYPSTRDLVEKAGGTAAVTQNPWTEQSIIDWMTQRVLSEVYTGAVDTVVADKAVIEQLGEPVETDIAASQLYRRGYPSDLMATSKTMEFDIIGPKGRGTVRVEATGDAAAQVGTGPIKILEITVTLEDGSVIDVDPPPEWNLKVR